MMQIYCDACRRQIKDAARGINYVAITDKTMCMPCNKKFEDKISSTMMSRKKYIFTDGKKTYLDMLHRICR